MIWLVVILVVLAVILAFLAPHIQDFINEIEAGDDH